MGRVYILGHVHLRGTDHHSTATLDELVEAAKRFGFRQIDLTPHLREPSDPNRPARISFDQLGDLWEKAKSQSAKRAGLGIALGFETNIVPIWHGSTILGVHLDIGPTTPLANPIVASCHFTAALGWPKERDSDTCPQQNPVWMLDSYLQVLESYTAPLDLSVIGHPFEYSPRPPIVEQVRALAVAAREAGVALEINLRRLLKVANPSTRILQQKALLLQPHYVEVLAETGVKIYLGTDIHNSNELGNLNNIQLVARCLVRNGIREEQIIGWED